MELEIQAEIAQRAEEGAASADIGVSVVPLCLGRNALVERVFSFSLSAAARKRLRVAQLKLLGEELRFKLPGGLYHIGHVVVRRGDAERKIPQHGVLRHKPLHLPVQARGGEKSFGRQTRRRSRSIALVARSDAERQQRQDVTLGELRLGAEHQFRIARPSVGMQSDEVLANLSFGL